MYGRRTRSEDMNLRLSDKVLKVRVRGERFWVRGKLGFDLREQVLTWVSGSEGSWTITYANEALV